MIDILLCGNLVNGFEVVIYSTMLHTHNIHWHIMTMSVEVPHETDKVIYGYNKLTDSDVEWLRYIARYMDGGSELTVYDVKEQFNEHLADSVNKDTGFTPYAACRLLADIVLPVNHCLYMDADVIVQEDLTWMYQYYTSIDTDYCAYTIPNARDGFGEMISSVMILNLDKLRESHVLTHARHNYRTRTYKFPDQTALSDAKDPYPLLETYNYMYDHKEALYKPAILHFSHANTKKIYSVPTGEFYRYYPEHRYIKDGLDIIRETYKR